MQIIFKLFNVIHRKQKDNLKAIYYQKHRLNSAKEKRTIKEAVELKKFKFKDLLISYIRTYRKFQMSQKEKENFSALQIVLMK